MNIEDYLKNQKRNCFMQINDKNILIVGVIIFGMAGMIFNYQEALIASISVLIGYLANDSDERKCGGVMCEKRFRKW